MKPLTFQISTTSDYDKVDKSDKDSIHAQVVKNWSLNTYNWDKETLVQLTTTQGVCGANIRDGIKSTKGGHKPYMGTYCLLFDLEKGWDIEEALAQQAKWPFNSYLHTSLSHGLHGNRFHVIVPLDRPFVQASEILSVKDHFIELFGSAIDHSSFDKTRYFCHGTDIVSSFVGDKGHLNFIEYLRSFEVVKEKKRQVGRPRKTEQPTFGIDDMITTSDYTEICISDIKKKTPVVCPFCGLNTGRGNPGKHNATITLGDNGLYYLYCSSCDGAGRGLEGKYFLHPDDAFEIRANIESSLVFIDTITQTHWTLGLYPDPETGERVLRANKPAKDSVWINFLKKRKIPRPDVFPELALGLYFNKDDVINIEGGYVNKYMAPVVLKSPIPEGYKAELPNYINKVIDHALGHDKEVIEHFYNNMAHIVQKRKKMIVSFLMQGVPGTGKGIVYEIFKEIFGADYCANDSQDVFNKEFNSTLERKVFAIINEVSVDFSKDTKSVAERMKMAITETSPEIEGKNKDRKSGKNHCSFLFATNDGQGVVIQRGDRRFNVAARQPIAIKDADWWLNTYDEVWKEISEEIQTFVWWLKQYSVDVAKTIDVVDNEPKRLLQTLASTNEQDFFENMVEGNLPWFMENCIKQDGYDADNKFKHIENIISFLKDPSQDEKGYSVIKPAIMCEIYNYLNHKNLPSISFSKRASMHRVLTVKNSTGYMEFRVVWK